MRFSPALLVLAFTAHCSLAFGDTIFDDRGAQMDILIGTSTLTAPGGPFVSTYMTLGWGTSLFDPSDLSSIVSSFASQMAADNTLPAIVQNNIESYVPSNLGYSTDPDVFSDVLDPELYSLLTTQPVPFAITSDSGYAAYAGGFFWQYVADSLPQNCPQNSPGNTIVCDYILDVNIYTRSIDETAIATPEPAALLEMGFVGAIVMLTWGVRRHQTKRYCGTFVSNVMLESEPNLR